MDFTKIWTSEKFLLYGSVCITNVYLDIFYGSGMAVVYMSLLALFWLLI